MATIPEVWARIHALWAKGDTRTFDESVELGRLLTALKTEMPPGDFYVHVRDVLRIPARIAQDFMRVIENFGSNIEPLFQTEFLPNRPAQRDPLVNLYEERGILYIELLVLGVDPGTFELSMMGNSVTIAGERRRDTEPYHNREQTTNKFVHTIELPVEVDADQVQANYHNGLLLVTLPKAEGAKSKQISIPLGFTPPKAERAKSKQISIPLGCGMIIVSIMLLLFVGQMILDGALVRYAFGTRTHELKPIAMDKNFDLIVHFIDVGQGNAVLVKFDGGNFLYDCGDKGKGRALFEYLKEQKVNKIDALIASHAHRDHIGSCYYLLKRMQIISVYSNNSPSSLGFFKSFKEIAAEKAKYYDVNQDRRLAIGLKDPSKNSLGSNNKHSVELLVAYDTRSKLSEDDRSLVVKLVYNHVSFLFMGDCERACEEEVVKDINRNINILLVGNHGNTDSSSEAFVRAISPKIAIIQVGKDNPNKHPGEEVLKRLKTVGAVIYRTDWHGTIIVKTDGQEIEVQTER